MRISVTSKNENNSVRLLIMKPMKLRIEENGTLVIPPNLLYKIDLHAGDKVTIYHEHKQLIISPHPPHTWRGVVTQPDFPFVENFMQQTPESEGGLSEGERKALWKHSSQRR